MYVRVEHRFGPGGVVAFLLFLFEHFQVQVFQVLDKDCQLFICIFLVLLKGTKFLLFCFVFLLFFLFGLIGLSFSRLFDFLFFSSLQRLWKECLNVSSMVKDEHSCYKHCLDQLEALAVVFSLLDQAFATRFGPGFHFLYHFLQPIE